jgi:hypothetical protein
MAKRRGKRRCAVTPVKYRLCGVSIFLFHSLNKHALRPYCVLEMGLEITLSVPVDLSILSGSYLEIEGHIPMGCCEELRNCTMPLHPCPFFCVLFLGSSNYNYQDKA